MDKIVGIQDLIAKKLEREEKQNETIEISVKSMDKSLLFKKPSEDIILDIMDEMQSSNMHDIISATDKLIYFCCPLLQNPQLQTQLEIVDPFDIVKAIFELTERSSIGEKLGGFIGISDKETQIKN
ncbi:MAG: hypothetical protein RSF40_11035 [Oscillospiraceae bacterium]